MFRPLSKPIMAIALSAGLLTACSSTPPSRTLLNGITADNLATKSGSVDVNGLRAASDPVCAQFYDNAINFATAASRPNPGGQLLAITGINVLAAVVSNGLLGGIGSQTGSIAAQVATSQLINAGGNAAISGLNSSRGPDRAIIKKAAEINCPVNII